MNFCVFVLFTSNFQIFKFFTRNQELKNGEICHRLDQVAGNFQHEFTAPIEYFQRLVFTFESRISNYRQELEELEAFLTSASPINDFSPQGNNAFITLNFYITGVFFFCELHSLRWRNISCDITSPMSGVFFFMYGFFDTSEIMQLRNISCAIIY